MSPRAVPSQDKHLVSPSESRLLHLLRCLLGRGTLAELQRQLSRHSSPEVPQAPHKLSPTCIRLVQQMLARGVVERLARLGWRRERFLRGSLVAQQPADSQPIDVQPCLGRSWERTAPEQRVLRFSAESLSFLLWLSSEQVLSTDLPSPAQPLTIADQLFFVIAYEFLRAEKTLAPKLHARLRTSPLGWLLFVDDCSTGTSSPAESPQLDFTDWTAGLGGLILEAVQPWLAQRWIEVDSQKQFLTHKPRVLQLGDAQATVLTQFFDTLEQAQRRDLARFVFQVGQATWDPTQPASQRLDKINLADLTMRERQQLLRSALTTCHQFARLVAWQAAATTTAFYDDGYAASQLWKQDWEQLGGAQLQANARTLTRDF